MWQYTNQDELYHYGVLGMKWGMHRAAKKGTTYTYQSHGQKKYNKKINKAVSKGKYDKLEKYTKKMDMFVERDKNRQNYAKNTKVGYAIARGILMGPFGNGSYSRLRSAGHNKLPSGLIATFASPVEPFLSRYMERHTARTKQ